MVYKKYSRRGPGWKQQVIFGFDSTNSFVPYEDRPVVMYYRDNMKSPIWEDNTENIMKWVAHFKKYSHEYSDEEILSFEEIFTNML